MKACSLSRWTLALGLPALFAACGIPSPLSAQSPAPEGAAAAADLEAHRQDFIDTFQRIGLNTTPGDAMLLRILVESSGAKRGVEVGSATGYGAIVMGLAFERNGGRLTTIDIDPQMVKTTRENLAKVRLDKVVDAVEGDALKVLPTLAGPIDFLFLDAVKKDYLKYLELVEDKLEPGAVIVADNVIKSAAAMQDFLGRMAKDADYHMVIVRASEEKGDGMAILYKLR